MSGPDDPGTPGVLRDVVVAVCGALTGLVAALPLLLRGRRQRVAPIAPVLPVAPVAPVAPVLPLALVHDYGPEIATLTEAVEHLETEVARVRTRIHDIASQVGAAAMIPSMMGTLNDLRERLARIEGKLGRRDANVE